MKNHKAKYYKMHMVGFPHMRFKKSKEYRKREAFIHSLQMF